jgi:hypothetical protein
MGRRRQYDPNRVTTAVRIYLRNSWSASATAAQCLYRLWHTSARRWFTRRSAVVQNVVFTEGAAPALLLPGLLFSPDS